MGRVAVAIATRLNSPEGPESTAATGQSGSLSFSSAPKTRTRAGEMGAPVGSTTLPRSRRAGTQVSIAIRRTSPSPTSTAETGGDGLARTGGLDPGAEYRQRVLPPRFGPVDLPSLEVDSWAPRGPGPRGAQPAGVCAAVLQLHPPRHRQPLQAHFALQALQPGFGGAGHFSREPSAGRCTTNNGNRIRFPRQPIEACATSKLEKGRNLMYPRG